MADLVRIRPRSDAIHIARSRSILVTSLEGLVPEGPDYGLFVEETRLLSRWWYSIDGVAPSPNVSSVVRQNEWTGYYITVPPGAKTPRRDDGSGQIPDESRSTVELRVRRKLDGALHEDLRLTNFGSEQTSFVLSIHYDADFADVAETRARLQNGSRSIRVNDEERTTVVEYVARHQDAELHRSVEIRVQRSSTPPMLADEWRISFEVTLEPRQQWTGRIRVRAASAAVDDSVAVERKAADRITSSATRFEAGATVGTLTNVVIGTLDQAREDLASLRLRDLDEDRGWTVAAGLPLYVALFGRDTLTTGWQAGMLGPEMMTGALGALARLQGTRVDDWRDEQPGKMLHEAHTGPLAELGLNPRGRSYSSITTSGLYAFIVAELWHWTGDRDLVRRYIEPALRALQWLERYGDPDGDGFYEYQTRSPMGPVHQAWKDSPDAIVYENGDPVEPPIATCEEQAFVYVAKLHLAETLWSLGEHELSRRLYRQAAELKKRFNDAFWMEDEGFFALALDARKRPVRSITSNPGHCLAAAIADAGIVERVADRLFAEDLFSGWGIRTLSSDHPRYNPYSYHLGSVWPVEQGTFALGFWRYGLHERVQQIARAQFEAAALFEHYRLPELFGGHARDQDTPFPGVYPGANPMQAWSSSAVFTLLQAMLGIYPYAPLQLLVVDPHLPDWLPEITLASLRVGSATVTMRFVRGSDGRTSYRVLEKKGRLRIVRQATPWSLTTQPARRMFDALQSLLPHH